MKTIISQQSALFFLFLFISLTFCNGSATPKDCSNRSKICVRYIWLPSLTDTTSSRWFPDGQKIILETVGEVKKTYDHYRFPSKPLTLSEYPKTIMVDIATGEISDFKYLGKTLFRPYFSPKGNFVAFIDTNENLVIQGLNKNNTKQRTVIEKKLALEKTAKERQDFKFFHFDRMHWSTDERFLVFLIKGNDFDAVFNGILGLFDLHLKNLTILDPSVAPFSLYPVAVWGDKSLYFIKKKIFLLSLNITDFKVQALYKSDSELSYLHYYKDNIYFLEGTPTQVGGLYRISTKYDIEKSIYKFMNGVSLYSILLDYKKKITNNVKYYDIRRSDGLGILKKSEFDPDSYSNFLKLEIYDSKANSLKLLNISDKRTFPGTVSNILWAPDGSKFFICGYDESDRRNKNPVGKPLLVIVNQ